MYTDLARIACHFCVFFQKYGSEECEKGHPASNMTDKTKHILRTIRNSRFTLRMLTHGSFRCSLCELWRLHGLLLALSCRSANLKSTVSPCCKSYLSFRSNAGRTGCRTSAPCPCWCTSFPFAGKRTASPCTLIRQGRTRLDHLRCSPQGARSQ